MTFASNNWGLTRRLLWGLSPSLSGSIRECSERYESFDWLKQRSQRDAPLVLFVRKIDARAQRIDGYYLENFEITLAGFRIQVKLGKV